MDDKSNFEMKERDGFILESYDRHKSNYVKVSQEVKSSGKEHQWLDKTTTDYWRHERMYKTMDPIITADLSKAWLTVGDGRYGVDSKYISDKGVNVLPTDLSGELLKVAKETGFIRDYREENAEHLSFDDCSFDYVCCKEAYHHFPRPAIALYEMIRVARDGVVLIEPVDRFISEKVFRNFFRKCVDFTKKIFNVTNDRIQYEVIGNFIYSVSPRELEKVAAGLGLWGIAYKHHNDFYIKGGENEYVADNGPIYRKLKRKIMVRDVLSKLLIAQYGLITAVVFKEKPDEALRNNMADSGFEIVEIKSNPYL